MTTLLPPDKNQVAPYDKNKEQEFPTASWFCNHIHPSPKNARKKIKVCIGNGC